MKTTEQTTGYVLLGLETGYTGAWERSPWRVLRRQESGWDNAPLWHEGERRKAAGEIADYRVVHVSHIDGDRFAAQTGLSGRIID